MSADVRKGDKWVFNRDGGKITLTGFYTVVYASTDHATPEKEVIYASFETPIPDMGTACDVENWGWLFVAKKTARHDSPHNLTVEIVYSNVISEQLANSSPIDPALQKPEINFFTVSAQEKIDKDKDGNAITNSANETPDPPLMEDDMWLGMRVVKYYSSDNYNPNNYANYKQSINSGTFTIRARSGTYQFADKTVKFIEESMEEVEISKDKTYSKVTRVFHIRADSLKWKRRLLDEGFSVVTGSNIKPATSSAKAQRIVTKELTNPEESFDANTNPYIFTPTPEPTLLDGSGGILAYNGTPVYLEKETLTAKSYSGII